MLKIWTSILVIMVVLTGCFSNGPSPAVGNEQANSLEETLIEQVESAAQAEQIEEAVIQEAEPPEARQEIVVKSMLSGPATGKLTVLDLKRKYEADSTEVLMPLYNVELDEKFTFNFKADMEGISAADIISIHSDSKALPLSQIEANVEFLSPESSVLEVSPWIATMASLDTKGGFGAIWGHAPLYYIRINYDVDSPTPLKLAKPAIIPFTVKSDVPAPDLSYEIDETGGLRLTWDRVEGAEGYNIYYVYSDSMSKKVNGAEEGYKEVYPVLEATVQSTEFVLSHEEVSGDTEYTQNFLNPGAYYLTAVKGSKESNFGNEVSIAALASQLPVQMGQFNYIYHKLSELPKELPVEFLDHTIAYREVIYDLDNPAILQEGVVSFRMKGTALRDQFVLDNVPQEDYRIFKAARSKKAKTGLADPHNSGTSVPAPNVPTIIGAGKAAGTKDAVLDLISQQRQNTLLQVNEGDSQRVPEPEVLMTIGLNADSAVEEYLARSMIDGREEISLLAFPEVQNNKALIDYVEKVVYQNPLILGIHEYYYDYTDVSLLPKRSTSGQSIGTPLVAG